MKTPRDEKCEICGEWDQCVWSVNPIRKLCASCHAGFVLGEPEGTE